MFFFDTLMVSIVKTAIFPDAVDVFICTYFIVLFLFTEKIISYWITMLPWRRRVMRMPSWASWIWLAVMLPRGNLSKMVFIQTKRSGNMFMDIQFMFHDIYESRSKGNASKRIANHYTHRKQIRQGKPVIAIEFENTN